ncbi:MULTISPECIES: L-methionine/branched-chain amino acid transporter [Shewanella]|uniref:L-methionine/branched-chain amino acid transporter n=1 Tax=Shewanella TaxID=22 RepID=UPI001EFDFA85|nr:MULTISPECIES: L-methionine/branched-chain amino acid transporter [Shewanella]MCG9748363.1 L-methionine/branched-chain amino acid transporter [Shewanella sp. Isolate8]MCL2911361.1 L-methionine/branched-chain amino acid transporter [Shewanella aquimarina]
MEHNHGTIGRWQGAGLMATTLLGTGVFILPEMTIATAGSGALLAWILLTLAIIPVTLVFARLAGVFPHAAGPAYFVEKAFGRTAGRTTGLIFLLVVPIGTPAAILMTFQFINALVPLVGWQQLMTELALLLLLLALNLKGIQVSAKLQFALTLAIVSVVVILFGAGGAKLGDLELAAPQAGSDMGLVMAAAGIAFWSFLGIEAMTHLANDFKRPDKDMLPAMIIGTILVGLVYVTCTLLLLFVPKGEGLAMVNAFDHLLGGYGAQVIGILGIAGGLSTVNVYTASVARLIWSFSREGVLPRYFDKLNQHRVPVRALVAVLLTMATVICLTYLFGQELEHLIAWTNGVFVLIYLVSMLAAAKLLSKRYLPLVITGVGFCLAMTLALGANMLYALLLVSVLAPLLWWQKTHLVRKQTCRVG